MKSLKNIKENAKAVTLVKTTFSKLLCKELNLTPVPAPLFVAPESGLNNDLNGIERPVSFALKSLPGRQAVIVHSLAKWKRMALSSLAFQILLRVQR